MEYHEQPVRFDEIIKDPALADHLFADMDKQGRALTLERGGKLYSLMPKRRPWQGKRGHFRRSDSLFDIVGMGASQEPTDIARHKHEYIAEAIESHFREQSEQ